MLKKYEVIQDGNKDCASSCILSIMKYYKITCSKDEINYLIKTDKNGTNAYNILEGIKYLGFDGYGAHFKYEDIIKGIISFPIIAHVLIKDIFYHFIVIYKVNTKKEILYVMDPAYGIRKMKFNEFKNIYQNTSIVIYPTKRVTSLEKKKTLYDFILNYLNIYKKESIITVFLTLITVVLGLISNLYTKIIIDEITLKYSLKMLSVISVCFLVNIIIKNIIDYIRNKYIININKEISYKINNDVIRHLLNLPYQFFKTKPTGEVISRINDLKKFKEIFTDILVNLSLDVILVLMSIVILLIINYKLFLVYILAIILYLIIVLIYSSVFKYKINNLQEKDSYYNKNLIDSIESYEINKNLNLQETNLNKLEVDYSIYLNSMKDYENTYNNQLIIKNLIMDITFIISNFISVILIVNKSITIGDFVLFNSLIYYFTEPIKNLMDSEPNFNYIKNTYRRINDILLMKQNESSIKKENIKGNIIIKDLKYTYNNMKLVLENVNLNINYKDKILIYGKSGTGKSTLVKLLLKYIDNYEGEVFINDINIKDIDSSVIANSFTYVSQHNYLINDTLKNNIIYQRDIKDSEYERILKICNVDKMRDKFPLRNNHLIEDNGFNLSGGERQKVILARSLLKKSNYIVLDEALSEVGFDEEKEILNKIIDYFKDKTIIYISHKKEIIDMFENKYYLERREKC